MADITKEEKDFMERPDRHPGESVLDQITRHKGTDFSLARARVQQRTLRGQDTVRVGEAKDSRFAMDAVVPNRGTEDERKGFYEFPSDEEREREIRNAHARANITNERGR